MKAFVFSGKAWLAVGVLGLFSALSALPPPALATPLRDARASASLPFHVDWGELAHYFHITNVRVEQKLIKDDFGRVTQIRALVFDVKAKHDFLAPSFLATIHEVFALPGSGQEFHRSHSFLVFESGGVLNWHAGQQGRAYVELPVEIPGMSKVTGVFIGLDPFDDF